MESTSDGWTSRIVGAFAWIAIGVEVFGLGAAGALKFLDAATWSARFGTWGYPAGFSYAVGVLEIAGVLLLIPKRSSSYAGAVLITVMLAALVTVLSHPGQLGPSAPLMHISILALIVALRWRSRWRRGRPGIEKSLPAG